MSSSRRLRGRGPVAFFLRPLQKAAEAHVELASDEPINARDVGGVEREAGEQLALRGLAEGLAHAVHTADQRHAMDAVERRELVDGESVDVMLAQQHALARPQQRERFLERRLELDAVAL